MEALTNRTEIGVYDTAIKDIAGLKDYSLIFKVIEGYFNQSESTEAIINSQNEFDIRTEKTRSKVTWAINKSVLQFINQDHKDLIREVFKSDRPHQDKVFVFLWHFAINNRLFREITINVFVKNYFSGRASVSKDDIIGYIKEIQKCNDPSLPRWSDNTIYRLATKYLSLMTKFGFVSTGRVKSFRRIHPSSEAQVLFLYFSKLFAPTMGNILTNELLPISFIPLEDIQDRLKKLSLKGFFNMNFNGVALNIELTHSYKGICDALYN